MLELSPWFGKQNSALRHEQRWFCEPAIKLPEGQAGLHLEVSCNSGGVLICHWLLLKVNPAEVDSLRLLGLSDVFPHKDPPF